MVYFECQKCNETVKKPKLAKHLMTCGSGYVSCIDCSKVFAWDEWEAHTSCVSEAQKYQGNLFQAKESMNKGQKKQDAWLENVKAKIEDPKSVISPQLKSLLEKLLGFDNIPRKQKPFANFVKNSLKLWDERKIAEIWEVINVANAAPPKQEAAPQSDAKAVARPSDEKASSDGWKRALDDELRAAGGEMPWKRLRDAMVTRHCGLCEPNGNRELLGELALASIPDSYLSKKDGLVRTPK
mmetsp:Transcript_74988/g.208486  ORF Transcript_74988/g.208486 Transcript_74988/m.208486 type:complete len:240 (+) Transcript_74988:82-801(+)